MALTTSLSAGSSASITLAAGASLRLSGLGTAQLAPPGASGYDNAPRTLTPSESTFGPYSVAVTVNVSAASAGGGVSYYTLAARDAILPTQATGGPNSAVSVDALQGYSAYLSPITLSATTTGQRQAVGGAKQLSLTCAAGCTLYYRFSDASGAIAAVTTDTPAVLSTTATTVNVPAGYPFFEYVLASSTASVVLSMLA